MSRNEWTDAQSLICDKWRELVRMPIEEDPQGFLEAIRAPCPFRTQAQEDIDSLGVPRQGLKLKPEDFCHGCLDLGGCEPVEIRVKALLDKSDYLGARQVVRHHLDQLEQLELPDGAS
jgi:hypothetical protein